STVPALAAGEVAVIEVSSFTVKVVAPTLPKFTADAPTKPLPVIVTLVPPAIGPEVGSTFATVGGATYVNWSAELVALVPPGPETVMSTVPADSAGATAVICPSLSTEKLGAATPPKSTSVVPVNCAPAIVTLVPPAVGPEFGDTLEIVGFVPITV